MGFSYFIPGTGVGKAIAHCLAGQNDTEFITIGDIDYEKAKKLAEKIENEFPVECEAVKFDAREAESGLRRAGWHNVIVSALPAQLNFGLASAALKTKMNFCDLGGVLPVTRKIKTLYGQAYKERLAIVPDCGLMPGLGVMIAKQLVLRSIMKEPDAVSRDVIIYVGGLPQKPQPPLYYQRVFSLEGLRHLCYDEPYILEDGVIKLVKPLSGYETLNIKELAKYSSRFNGKVEAFITAGAALAPWDFRKLGVTSLCEKTIRWPGFVRAVSSLEEESFEQKIGPMSDIPVDEAHPDLVWMRVDVRYKTKCGCPQKLSSSMFVGYDESLELSAMEMTTGFPTALIARKIAKGELGFGVFTPDEVPERSLNRLIAETGNYFKIQEN